MNNLSSQLIGLLCCLAVIDAQAGSLASVTELPDMVVSDSILINPNVATPGSQNRSQAISADGGEFLRQLPGISASRFGGRGLEPVIRGQSQTRLNILLDGAYVHGGCPNRMDPPASWAALETYEEVKVLKGMQSLIYGGGGSGGTVLFERDTRSLAEEPGVHGRVSGGATDNGVDYDVLGDIVAAAENAYLRTFVELKNADNYQDGDGRKVRSAYDHKQGGLILGWTPGVDTLVEFSYERNDFEDALYPGAGMDSPKEDGDFYRLRLENDFNQGWLQHLKVETYISDIDHVMNNYSLRTPPVYTSPPFPAPKAGQPILRETPTSSNTRGARIVLVSTFDSTSVEYGLDMQNNERDGQLNNMEGPVPVAISLMWPDVELKQYGVFAEATTPLSADSRLKVGVRVDRVRPTAGKADNATSTVSANTAYSTYYGLTDADADDETNVGALLRYTRDINANLTLFTGLSRSVRTADATERFMNKWGMPLTRWVGNPGINPEKHHQFDLGLAWTERSLGFNAVVFYDDVDDYILRDTARGQDGILRSDFADIYRNVDARLAGVELDGWMELTDHLELSGYLAYVRAKNTTDSDRNIAQTPPLNGRLQLDYARPDWAVGTRLRFADQQNKIDSLSKQEVGKTPGWGVLDIYGNYYVTDRVNVRLGVDNLFDNTYAEHINRANLLDPFAVQVNEPGRTAWLKLDAEF